MKNKGKAKLKLLFQIQIILCLNIFSLYSQDINIIPQLKKIEAGKIEEVKSQLKILKTKNKNSPNLIFLDAVLTETGEVALKKYTDLYLKYPQSQFADAAVFRIFSYYYALGYYKRANEYLTKLKKEYPKSHYIKIAERNIPPSKYLDKRVIVKNKTELSNSDNRNFTIQAGAFLNYNYALRLKKRFERTNLKTRISKKEIAGSILNVVTVGKFETENEARTVLQKINRDFKINGRVVRNK